MNQKNKPRSPGEIIDVPADHIEDLEDIERSPQHIESVKLYHMKRSEPLSPNDVDLLDAYERRYRSHIANLQKQIDSIHRIKPAPAESMNIHPMETPPHIAKEKGEEQRSMGATVPTYTRPQAPTAKKEDGSVIIAKGLGEQLGTSPELKAQMRIDERKMGVLQDETLAALSHFSYRYVYDEVRYWGHITEWWLTGSQGIGGLARRHILQALANTSGVQVHEKAEKPNALARNIWDRKWKEKAEAEGKTVE